MELVRFHKWLDRICCDTEVTEIVFLKVAGGQKQSIAAQTCDKFLAHLIAYCRTGNLSCTSIPAKDH
jgi:hypothetical protein